MANLKSIFWCLTQGEWKRSSSLSEAQQLAIKKGRLTKHVFYQALFTPETTDEKLEELGTLWCIAGLGEIMKCNDLTEQDEALIDNHLVGWVTHEYEVKKQK